MMSWYQIVDPSTQTTYAVEMVWCRQDGGGLVPTGWKTGKTWRQTLAGDVHVYGMCENGAVS